MGTFKFEVHKTKKNQLRIKQIGGDLKFTSTVNSLCVAFSEALERLSIKPLKPIKVNVKKDLYKNCSIATVNEIV